MLLVSVLGSLGQHDEGDPTLLLGSSVRSAETLSA